MAKATLDLINKLRGQLPPEAAAQLDDLEMYAADGEEGQEDELMLDGHESDEGGMKGLRDTMGMDEEDEPMSDEPVDVNASAGLEEEEEEEMAPVRKPTAKPKKKSFFS